MRLIHSQPNPRLAHRNGHSIMTYRTMEGLPVILPEFSTHFQYGSRSTFFRIFPIAFLGRSSRNLTAKMRWRFASCELAHSRISSSFAVAPLFRMSRAKGDSPHLSFGIAITHASATAGCCSAAKSACGEQVELRLPPAFARDWPATRPAADLAPGIWPGPKPSRWGFPMLTSNRSDFQR